MNDPFGVSKARNGPGYSGAHDPSTSMTQRKPDTGTKRYYAPTEEQKAASTARRLGQQGESAAAKAARYYKRTGGGKTVGLAHHFNSMGKSPHVFAPIIAGGLIAGAELHHRTKVNKALSTKEKTENYALGGAAGTAGGATAMQFGGHAVKATLKERRAKRGQSPAERDIWAAHRAKYGASNNGKNMWQSYSKYPKELPDWKLQRALAFKNRPAVSTGIVAAGTAAGLAYAHHRNKEANVSKSAFGIDHDGGNVEPVGKRAIDPDRRGKVFGSPLATAAVVGGAGAALVGRRNANAIGAKIAGRVVRRADWSAARAGSMKNKAFKATRLKYADTVRGAGKEIGRTDDTKEVAGRATAGAIAGTAAGGVVYGRKRLTPVDRKKD